MWGEAAHRHWQHHLPEQLAALQDPDRFFSNLDDEANAYYVAVRDGMLQGVNPNTGLISWAEFMNRVAWANQVARELVETELIYIPGEDSNAAPESGPD